MFKVNNKDTRTMPSYGNIRTRCKIFSKLTKTPERHFEYISHLVLVSLLLTLNM